VPYSAQGVRQARSRALDLRGPASPRAGCDLGNLRGSGGADRVTLGLRPPTDYGNLASKARPPFSAAVPPEPAQKSQALVRRSLRW